MTDALPSKAGKDADQPILIAGTGIGGLTVRMQVQRLCNRSPRKGPEAGARGRRDYPPGAIRALSLLGLETSAEAA